MWTMLELEKLCDITIGKTPSRSNPKLWDKGKDSGNVWLSIADMSSISGKYIGDSKEYVSNEGARLFKSVPKDTLVMSFKLSIGKLAITTRELRTNEAIAALKIKNDSLISKDYLYHYLSCLDWDVIAGNAVKVKGKTLNKAKLKALPIRFPSLTEQNRIVGKLDAAFSEIDNAIELTKAKESEIKNLKSVSLRNLFSRYSYNSKDVPLEFCVETFHQGLNTAGEKVKFSEIGYPVLQTRNINNGTLDFQEKIKFVDESLWKKYREKYKPQVGDVFFTNIGTIGKTAVIYEDVDYLIHWNIFKIRAKQEEFLPEYIKLNLDYLTDTGYFTSLQKGGTVSFVTKKMIGAAPIVPIPINQQKELLDIYHKVSLKLSVSKSKLTQTLSLLQILKSSILSKELKDNEAA